jgi:ferredoxin-NADP reductase
MSYSFFDCEVTEILDENAFVKRFILRYPEASSFHFKAGQFIMLDLPIIAKHTTRSYSIASPPTPDRQVELCIVLKPNGAGTEYLFKEIKIGSTVKGSLALGKFTLPEVIDYDICFICTGTGVAPFRSMIFDIFNKKIPHKNIYLIFGNRQVADILYKSEFESLALREPSFKFIPVLSRADATDWKGAHGYVHEVYEKLFREKNDTHFYLCGWQAMLKEARQRLAVLGYPVQQIRFESFE